MPFEPEFRLNNAPGLEEGEIKTSVTCDWHKYKTVKEAKPKQDESDVKPEKVVTKSKHACDETIDKMLDNLNLLKTDLSSQSDKNEFLQKVPVLKTRPKLTSVTKKHVVKICVDNIDNDPLATEIGCFDS